MFKIAFMLCLAAAVACGSDGNTTDPKPPQDFPPRAVETFEPQTLQAGRDVLTIDFRTAFQDPEGMGLTYAATSSNASVLTVSFSGTVLKITAVAEGSATASVEARDSGGNTARITIAVTVTPAPVIHVDDDKVYTQAPYLEVGGGRIGWFATSPSGLTAQGTGACIEIDPKQTFTEQNLRFQVTRSRWQKRDDYYASGWITVEGSERNDNSLCLITFPGPGQYRLVVDVNGNRISSNVVVGSN